jgi:hypothetical protein
MVTSGEGDGLLAAALAGYGAAPLTDWLIEHLPGDGGGIALRAVSPCGHLHVTRVGNLVDCQLWSDYPASVPTHRTAHAVLISERDFADRFPGWLADCLASAAIMAIPWH